MKRNWVRFCEHIIQNDWNPNAVGERTQPSQGHPRFGSVPIVRCHTGNGGLRCLRLDKTGKWIECQRRTRSCSPLKSYSNYCMPNSGEDARKTLFKKDRPAVSMPTTAECEAHILDHMKCSCAACMDFACQWRRTIKDKMRDRVCGATDTQPKERRWTYKIGGVTRPCPKLHKPKPCPDDGYDSEAKMKKYPYVGSPQINWWFGNYVPSSDSSSDDFSVSSGSCSGNDDSEDAAYEKNYRYEREKQNRAITSRDISTSDGSESDSIPEEEISPLRVEDLSTDKSSPSFTKSGQTLSASKRKIKKNMTAEDRKHLRSLLWSNNAGASQTSCEEYGTGRSRGRQSLACIPAGRGRKPLNLGATLDAFDHVAMDGTMSNEALTDHFRSVKLLSAGGFLDCSSGGVKAWKLREKNKRRMRELFRSRQKCFEPKSSFVSCMDKQRKNGGDSKSTMKSSRDTSSDRKVSPDRLEDRSENHKDREGRGKGGKPKRQKAWKLRKSFREVEQEGYYIPEDLRRNIEDILRRGHHNGEQYFHHQMKRRQTSVTRSRSKNISEIKKVKNKHTSDDTAVQFGDDPLPKRSSETVSETSKFLKKYGVDYALTSRASLASGKNQFLQKDDLGFYHVNSQQEPSLKFSHLSHRKFGSYKSKFLQKMGWYSNGEDNKSDAESAGLANDKPRQCTKQSHTSQQLAIDTVESPIYKTINIVEGNSFWGSLRTKVAKPASSGEENYREQIKIDARIKESRSSKKSPKGKENRRKQDSDLTANNSPKPDKRRERCNFLASLVEAKDGETKKDDQGERVTNRRDLKQQSGQAQVTESETKSAACEGNREDIKTRATAANQLRVRCGSPPASSLDTQKHGAGLGRLISQPTSLSASSCELDKDCVVWSPWKEVNVGLRAAKIRNGKSDIVRSGKKSHGGKKDISPHLISGANYSTFDDESDNEDFQTCSGSVGDVDHDYVFNSPCSNTVEKWIRERRALWEKRKAARSWGETRCKYDNILPSGVEYVSIARTDDEFDGIDKINQEGSKATKKNQSSVGQGKTPLDETKNCLPPYDGKPGTARNSIFPGYSPNQELRQNCPNRRSVCIKETRVKNDRLSKTISGRDDFQSSRIRGERFQSSFSPYRKSRKSLSSERHPRQSSERRRSSSGTFPLNRYSESRSERGSSAEPTLREHHLIRDSRSRDPSITIPTESAAKSEHDSQDRMKNDQRKSKSYYPRSDISITGPQPSSDVTISKGKAGHKDGEALETINIRGPLRPDKRRCPLIEINIFGPIDSGARESEEEKPKRKHFPSLLSGQSQVIPGSVSRTSVEDSEVKPPPPVRKKANLSCLEKCSECCIELCRESDNKNNSDTSLSGAYPLCQRCKDQDESTNHPLLMTANANRPRYDMALKRDLKRLKSVCGSRDFINTEANCDGYKLPQFVSVADHTDQNVAKTKSTHIKQAESNNSHNRGSTKNKEQKVKYQIDEESPSIEFSPSFHSTENPHTHTINAHPHHKNQSENKRTVSTKAQHKFVEQIQHEKETIGHKTLTNTGLNLCLPPKALRCTFSKGKNDKVRSDRSRSRFKTVAANDLAIVPSNNGSLQTMCKNDRKTFNTDLAKSNRSRSISSKKGVESKSRSRSLSVTRSSDKSFSKNKYSCRPFHYVERHATVREDPFKPIQADRSRYTGNRSRPLSVERGTKSKTNSQNVRKPTAGRVSKYPETIWHRYARAERENQNWSNKLAEAKERRSRSLSLSRETRSTVLSPSSRDKDKQFPKVPQHGRESQTESKDGFDKQMLNGKHSIMDRVKSNEENKANENPNYKSKKSKFKHPSSANLNLEAEMAGWASSSRLGQEAVQEGHQPQVKVWRHSSLERGRPLAGRRVHYNDEMVSSRPTARMVTEPVPDRCSPRGNETSQQRCDESSSTGDESDDCYGARGYRGRQKLRFEPLGKRNRSSSTAEMDRRGSKDYSDDALRRRPKLSSSGRYRSRCFYRPFHHRKPCFGAPYLRRRSASSPHSVSSTSSTESSAPARPNRGHTTALSRRKYRPRKISRWRRLLYTSTLTPSAAESDTGDAVTPPVPPPSLTHEIAKHNPSFDTNARRHPKRLPGGEEKHTSNTFEQSPTRGIKIDDSLPQRKLIPYQPKSTHDTLTSSEDENSEPQPLQPRWNQPESSAFRASKRVLGESPPEQVPQWAERHVSLMGDSSEESIGNSRRRMYRIEARTKDLEGSMSQLKLNFGDIESRLDKVRKIQSHYLAKAEKAVEIIRDRRRRSRHRPRNKSKSNAARAQSTTSDVDNAESLSQKLGASSLMKKTLTAPGVQRYGAPPKAIRQATFICDKSRDNDKVEKEDSSVNKQTVSAMHPTHTRKEEDEYKKCVSKGEDYPWFHSTVPQLEERYHARPCPQSNRNTGRNIPHKSPPAKCYVHRESPRSYRHKESFPRVSPSHRDNCLPGSKANGSFALNTVQTKSSKEFQDARDRNRNILQQNADHTILTRNCSRLQRGRHFGMPDSENAEDVSSNNSNNQRLSWSQVLAACQNQPDRPGLSNGVTDDACDACSDESWSDDSEDGECDRPQAETQCLPTVSALKANSKNVKQNKQTGSNHECKNESGRPVNSFCEKIQHRKLENDRAPNLTGHNYSFKERELFVDSLRKILRDFVAQKPKSAEYQKDKIFVNTKRCLSRVYAGPQRSLSRHRNKSAKPASKLPVSLRKQSQFLRELTPSKTTLLYDRSAGKERMHRNDCRAESKYLEQNKNAESSQPSASKTKCVYAKRQNTYTQMYRDRVRFERSPSRSPSRHRHSVVTPRPKLAWCKDNLTNNYEQAKSYDIGERLNYNSFCDCKPKLTSASVLHGNKPDSISGTNVRMRTDPDNAPRPNAQKLHVYLPQGLEPLTSCPPSPLQRPMSSQDNSGNRPEEQRRVRPMSASAALSHRDCRTKYNSKLMEEGIRGLACQTLWSNPYLPATKLGSRQSNRYKRNITRSETNLSASQHSGTNRGKDKDATTLPKKKEFTGCLESSRSCQNTGLEGYVLLSPPPPPSSPTDNVHDDYTADVSGERQVSGTHESRCGCSRSSPSTQALYSSDSLCYPDDLSSPRQESYERQSVSFKVKNEKGDNDRSDWQAELHERTTHSSLHSLTPDNYGKDRAFLGVDHCAELIKPATEYRCAEISDENRDVPQIHSASSSSLSSHLSGDFDSSEECYHSRERKMNRLNDSQEHDSYRNSDILRRGLPARELTYTKTLKENSYQMHKSTPSVHQSTKLKVPCVENHPRHGRTSKRDLHTLSQAPTSNHVTLRSDFNPMRDEQDGGLAGSPNRVRFAEPVAYVNEPEEYLDDWETLTSDESSRDTECEEPWENTERVLRKLSADGPEQFETSPTVHNSVSHLRGRPQSPEPAALRRRFGQTDLTRLADLPPSPSRMRRPHSELQNLRGLTRSRRSDDSGCETGGDLDTDNSHY